MNQIVKEKWLKALRSGDYEQTKETLRDDRGFCCLGVLCDLAVKEGIIPEPEKIDNSTNYSYCGEAGILPNEVREWAELKFDNPHVFYTLSDEEMEGIYGPSWKDNSEITNTETDGISALNDELDYNFEQIADVIEAQL